MSLLLDEFRYPTVGTPDIVPGGLYLGVVTVPIPHRRNT